MFTMMNVLLVGKQDIFVEPKHARKPGKKKSQIRRVEDNSSSDEEQSTKTDQTKHFQVLRIATLKHGVYKLMMSLKPRYAVTFMMPDV